MPAWGRVSPTESFPFPIHRDLGDGVRQRAGAGVRSVPVLRAAVAEMCIRDSSLPIRNRSTPWRSVAASRCLSSRSFWSARLCASSVAICSCRADHSTARCCCSTSSFASSSIARRSCSRCSCRRFLRATSPLSFSASSSPSRRRDSRTRSRLSLIHI